MGPAAQIRAGTRASGSPGERGGVSRAGLARPPRPYTFTSRPREDPRFPTAPQPGPTARVSPPCAAGGEGALTFASMAAASGWQL